MPDNVDGRWTGASLFAVPPPDVSDGAGHKFSDTRGLFVLHAMLLHTGKVLCFCGHVEVSMYAPLCYLFDPAAPAATMSPIAFPPSADLFCCHYVQLPDGRILAAGGSELHGLSEAGFSAHGSTGSKTIAIFDPVTSSWSLSRTGGTPNVMRQGRWYPTLVVLPDGRVAVFSGRREFVDPIGPPPTTPVPPPGAAYIADSVEILSPPDWSTTELSGAAKPLPIYPGLHLGPSGRIYFTHTNWGQEMANPDTASILITAGAASATWTNYSGLKPPSPRREEGMSVVLPPAQDGRILVIGGSKALTSAGQGVVEPGGPGPSGFDRIENASDPRQADILDTSTEPPTWSSAGQMHFGRTNGHCVLLPDATVLICGGHNNYKWLSEAGGTLPSLVAEIYTPGVGFTTVAPAEQNAAGRRMAEPRMYHSIALLLADGRVLTAGGADANRSEPLVSTTVPDPYPAGWVGRRYGPGMPMNSKTFEIYEPPYCFKGPRPVLTDVRRNGASTRRIEYGQTFTATTAEAASIDKVAFMRPGACTHHTDTEQRYVRLTFTKGSGELTVTAVNDPKLAPPGYYMLWIVDSTGRPCRNAMFLQLVGLVGQPGGGTSCLVATVTFGSADHPCVVYLQGLRREISTGTRPGRWFTIVVNAIYGCFSPWVAGRLTNEVRRAAVRIILVRPVVFAISAAEKCTSWIHPKWLQHTLLMVLFIAEAIVGLAALPVLVAAVLLTIGLRQRQNHRGPHESSEDSSAK